MTKYLFAFLFFCPTVAFAQTVPFQTGLRSCTYTYEKGPKRQKFAFVQCDSVIYAYTWNKDSVLIGYSISTYFKHGHSTNIDVNTEYEYYPQTGIVKEKTITHHHWIFSGSSSTLEPPIDSTFQYNETGTIERLDVRSLRSAQHTYYTQDGRPKFILSHLNDSLSIQSQGPNGEPLEYGQIDETGTGYLNWYNDHGKFVGYLHYKNGHLKRFEPCGQPSEFQWPVALPAYLFIH